jgi:polyphosphate kinase
MNSLVDEAVIAALYEASRAGVAIELLVRGICCLRPGIQGVSENIRVRAQIDRFLEHARVFYFENGGDPAVYCSSADWMPRNFRRRVEAMFPILDTALRDRMVKEILGTMWADAQKSWELQADGTYARPTAEGVTTLRSQQRFIDLARDRTKDADGRLSLSSKRFVAVTDLQSALEKLRHTGKGKGKRKRRRGSRKGG